MTREVRLYGQLAKEFGRSHKLDVASTVEAVRAMETNYPGFTKRIKELGDAGYVYEISCGKKRREIGIDREDLAAPVSGAIFIAPVIQGAKSGGMFSFVAAAVLIVASFYFPPIGAAIGMSATTAAAVSTTMLHMGIALAIGGVIQLLAPSPKTGASSREASGMPSHLFNGAVNTAAQGHPVPVGYGEMIVGSAVISAGISSKEIPVNGSSSGSGSDYRANPAVLQATYGGNMYLDFTGEVINGVRAVGWFAGDGTKLAFDRENNVPKFAGVVNSTANAYTRLHNFRIVDKRGITRKVWMCFKRHSTDSRLAALAIATTDEAIKADALFTDYKFVAPNALIPNGVGVSSFIGGDANAPAYYEKDLSLVMNPSFTAPSNLTTELTTGTAGSFATKSGKALVFVQSAYCWMPQEVRDYLKTEEGSAISIYVQKLRSYDEDTGRYEVKTVSAGEIRINNQ